MSACFAHMRGCIAGMAKRLPGACTTCIYMRPKPAPSTPVTGLLPNSMQGGGCLARMAKCALGLLQKPCVWAPLSLLARQSALTMAVKHPGRVGPMHRRLGVRLIGNLPSAARYVRSASKPCKRGGGYIWGTLYTFCNISSIYNQTGPFSAGLAGGKTRWGVLKMRCTPKRLPNLLAAPGLTACLCPARQTLAGRLGRAR